MGKNIETASYTCASTVIQMFVFSISLFLITLTTFLIKSFKELVLLVFLGSFFLCAAYKQRNDLLCMEKDAIECPSSITQSFLVDLSRKLIIMTLQDLLLLQSTK